MLDYETLEGVIDGGPMKSENNVDTTVIEFHQFWDVVQRVFLTFPGMGNPFSKGLCVRMEEGLALLQ